MEIKTIENNKTVITVELDFTSHMPTLRKVKENCGLGATTRMLQAICPVLDFGQAIDIAKAI